MALNMQDVAFSVIKKKSGHVWRSVVAQGEPHM